MQLRATADWLDVDVSPSGTREENLGIEREPDGGLTFYIGHVDRAFDYYDRSYSSSKSINIPAADIPEFMAALQSWFEQ